jgi:hypothetical protein
LSDNGCLLAVDKDDLVPPVPVLTRYKKELGIKVFVKKEVHEVKTVDERKSSEITQLTMPKLCVRLNSLYVSFLFTRDCAHLHHNGKFIGNFSHIGLK